MSSLFRSFLLVFILSRTLRLCLLLLVCWNRFFIFSPYRPSVFGCLFSSLSCSPLCFHSLSLSFRHCLLLFVCWNRFFVFPPYRPGVALFLLLLVVQFVALLFLFLFFFLSISFLLDSACYCSYAGIDSSSVHCSCQMQTVASSRSSMCRR